MVLGRYSNFFPTLYTLRLNVLLRNDTTWSDCFAIYGQILTHHRFHLSEFVPCIDNNVKTQWQNWQNISPPLTVSNEKRLSLLYSTQHLVWTRIINFKYRFIINLFQSCMMQYRDPSETFDKKMWMFSVTKEIFFESLFEILQTEEWVMDK